MSFKPTSKKYNLVFDNIPGLTVTAKGTTLGKLQMFSGATVNLGEENRKKALELMGFFASRIITWNIVHPEVELSEEQIPEREPDDLSCPVCGLNEDDPLPTTLKGMECLEMALVLSIMFGWVAAVASASDPKGQSLNGGVPSIQEDLMRQLGELQSPLTL